MSTHKTVKYNSERYEKIRVLGKGSYGTASVHRRRTDCALVVLKEIELHRFKDEGEKFKVLREARIMSELCHENIIKYFNAYATDTRLIIEMEYARLGTLQAYLSMQTRLLEEEEILVIFQQILSGLAYLHSKSIVHLDLKMANIFVSSEGSIKIGDFGIAQIMPDSSQNSELNSCALENRLDDISAQQLGTLAYSSPERCLGRAVDFKSDIWSLGCILYELITLEPLFSGESLPELVIKITQIEYKRIERDIPSNIERLFEQMIERQLEDRPSADELISALDCLMAQRELRKQLEYNPKVNHRRYNHSKALGSRNNNKLDLSTEGAFLAQAAKTPMNPINYPHSLIYQVRLNSKNIMIDRVNLPQSKRIKEISKGRSHYLALTYDNIVYGWGSRNSGQLGACNLKATKELETKATRSQKSNHKSLRPTLSATNSFTAVDMEHLSHHRFTPDAPRASLTQPPSLASSTQTITLPGSSSPASRQILFSQSHNSAEEHLADSHFELLARAKPATKPFIVNELNKRKIEKVAAGDDFSVFLSRTGIVMTCGDGSRGCLGRGAQRRSALPCMVDSLLNMDVVDIACGPEHVVAICGNGQVFSWGNTSHGRLGLAKGESRHERRPEIGDARYVNIPQLVEFKHQDERSGSVLIKSATCGDRCTIFIDSNYNCWACGDNRHNRLGLDSRRRFKRTTLVKSVSQPVKVTSLSRYKIVSCKIGKNHSCFLTVEGKMLVFGQDIDCSFRFKSGNLMSGDYKHLIASELNRGASLARAQLHKNHCTTPTSASNAFSYPRLARIKRFNQNDYLRFFIESLLENDQMVGYKSAHSNKFAREHRYPKFKISRFQRQQIEAYVKKSRASKKMSFESVISMGCSSNFSLALTNDNRVYFWGVRSYDGHEKHIHLLCPKFLSSDTANREFRAMQFSAEPQLVANCSDSCFVKIGSTNSTLMTEIQLKGSDQPILHARDPRLIADSLSDLWILDYTPSSSASSSSADPSSSEDEYSNPFCEDIGTDIALKCFKSGKNLDRDDGADELIHGEHSCNKMGHVPKFCRYCQKHDPILKPQPLVSLYVPSMFNHCGSALKLVNLFCFDEDRFFLILDTTISLHHQHQQMPHKQQVSSPPRAHIKRASQSFKYNSLANTSRPWITANNLTYSNQLQAYFLDRVEESNNSGGRVMDEDRGQNENSACRASEAKMEQDVIGRVEKEDPGRSDDENLGSERDRSRRLNDVELTNLGITSPRLATRNVSHSSEEEFVAKSNAEGGNDDRINETLTSPTSFGLSLEEPRSVSTFAAALGNHLILSPSMNSASNLDESMRKLSFGPNDYADSLKLPFAHRRNCLRNNSESTGATADDNETSSMPTWVRDEFIRQEGVDATIHYNEDRQSNGNSSSTASNCSSSTEQTCLNEELSSIHELLQGDVGFGDASVAGANDGGVDTARDEISTSTLRYETNMAAHLNPQQTSVGESNHWEINDSSAVEDEQLHFSGQRSEIPSKTDRECPTHNGCQTNIESLNFNGPCSLDSLQVITSRESSNGRAPELSRSRSDLKLEKFGCAPPGRMAYLSMDLHQNASFNGNRVECRVHRPDADHLNASLEGQLYSCNVQRTRTNSDVSESSRQETILSVRPQPYVRKNSTGQAEAASVCAEYCTGNGQSGKHSRAKQFEIRSDKYSSSCADVNRNRFITIIDTSQRERSLSDEITKQPNHRVRLHQSKAHRSFKQEGSDSHKMGSRTSLSSIRKSLLKMFC